MKHKDINRKNGSTPLRRRIADIQPVMLKEYQLRMLQNSYQPSLQRLYTGRFGRCGRGQEYWRR